MHRELGMETMEWRKKKVLCKAETKDQSGGGFREQWRTEMLIMHVGQGHTAADLEESHCGKAWLGKPVEQLETEKT